MEESQIIPWAITSAILLVVPFWRLYKRTGFKPVFSLIALVPGGIVVLLWVVAFAKWPAFAEGKKDSGAPIAEEKTDSGPLIAEEKKDSDSPFAEEKKDSGPPIPP